MARLSVILLGVETPGNLGAVARAMKNFGVTELVLIEPKCSPEDVEAQNRAKWAKDVLKGARIEGRDAFDTFDLLIGTTGKLGDDYNLPRTPLFPDELAAKLGELDQDAQVGLLFGPEGDGLQNEELIRCDIVATIPTSVAYPSLNLSHAVAVMLYAIMAPSRAGAVREKFPLVRAPEKQQLRKLIEQTVTLLDFPAEEENRTQEVLWKRLVGKSLITQREAMALMGFFRRGEWSISHRTAEKNTR
jgi:tRNA/rRNA methyltransferase